MTSNCCLISLRVTLLALLFCYVPIRAQTNYRLPGSQKAAVCGGGSGGGCGTPSSGNSSSQPSAPSPAQIAAQKANALNDQGNEAFNKGDWMTAEAFYKKSLEITPNDPTVLRSLAITQHHEAVDAYKNGDYATALTYLEQALANDPTSDVKNNAVVRKDLAFIQGKIADAQREQEQRRQDKITAGNMQQAIQNLASSLSAAPSPGGLDFNSKQAGNNSDQSNGLAFMGSGPAVAGDHTQASGSVRAGVFGTPISNPQLEFSDSSQPVAVQSTSDQLASAANSGASASAKGISAEEAKVKSNCAFDTAACARFAPIPVRQLVGQSPGAAQLVEHIPAGQGRSDPLIQQSVAYYEKLDGLKIDAQTDLTAVQKKIDSGAGDAKLLNAQKVTLGDAIKRYDADQAKTEGQIKERLVTIGVPWNESPSPAPSGTAKQ